MTEKYKRIMVDMSATLIHQGHINLLMAAKEYGEVIVGLTTDQEIFDHKGYYPELTYTERKEVLKAIKYVEDVVPVPWLINEQVLEKYQIDFLVHGDDNANQINDKKMITLPRTPGISSTGIRESALRAITEKNNNKLMLTPGPASIGHENLLSIKPCFGRGDIEYDDIYDSTINWLKDIAEQDEIVSMQGSASLAIEVALRNFVSGRVLIISSGYYSDRLLKLIDNNLCSVKLCKYTDLDSIRGCFDWVLCAYTETSMALKLDLQYVHSKCKLLKAKLFIDATGSIGLEEDHGLADVIAFSSCKGLFGLTGAAFVCYKSNQPTNMVREFSFDINTYKNKSTTGPYHAISSIHGIMNKHGELVRRVKKSKDFIINNYKDIVRTDSQPLLCTFLKADIIPKDENVILYNTREKINGSIICHLGEVFSEKVNLDKRITIIPRK